MTFSRFLFVVVGALGAGVGLSLTMVACGGDDTTVTGPEDSGPDRTTTIDTGVDTGADTGADVRPDVVDAGPDGPAPPAAEFATAVNKAFCAHLRECCLIPASEWDESRCESVANAIGGFRGLTWYAESTRPVPIDAGADGGDAGFAPLQVDYNPANAQACLSQVANFACGVMQASTLVQLQTVCYSAFTGKLNAGENGCRTSLECKTGNWCNSGKCEAIKAVGATCVTTMNDPSQFIANAKAAHIASEQCSYLSNGTPAAFCDIPADGGLTGQCTGAVNLDAGCIPEGKAACASQLCVGRCVNQTVVTDPGVPNGTCETYRIKDAGGGG